MGSRFNSRGLIFMTQVVHAVSESLEGPYKYNDTLFDTFHHNPRLVKANDGSFLLFMIGGPHSMYRVLCLLAFYV